jgi:hypothetical protein
VGLVCRLLEERGIATVYVATGRDLATLVKPPRVLFVNHPMGNIFGKPGDVAMQTDILRTALGMTHSVEEGGTLADYPTSWAEPFEFAPGRMGRGDSASAA